MGFQAYILAARYDRPVTMASAFAHEGLYALLWLIITPMVIAMARQLPLTSERWRRSILPHFAASLLVAFAHKVIYHLVVVIATHGISEGILLLRTQPIFTYIDYGALIYWVIVLTDSAAAYYTTLREEQLQRAQLETELAQAQLQALRMQLQPHFLFNTLNAISVLVEKDPKTARAMLLSLSDLLRITLHKMTGDTVTLRQEIDFIERYLQIERMRFADRLAVTVNAPAELMDAGVPAMILQPLVENAMRHGVAMRRGPAELRIDVSRNNGTLRLSVFDNGPGVPPGAIAEGIGLANVKARLEQRYGTHHQFSAGNGGQGGFIADLSIPFTPMSAVEPANGR